MTRDEAKQAIMDDMPGGSRKFLIPMLFLVEAVVGGLIGWLVPRVMNKWCPEKAQQAMLRRQIRKQCDAAAGLEQAREAGVYGDGAALDAQVGDDIFTAVLAARKRLGDVRIDA